MAERLRQHYLQALGIETYVPRRTLPGAAASLSNSQEMESTAPEKARAPLEPADAVVPTPRSLSDTMFGEQSKPARKPRAAPPPAGRRPDSGFVLSAWRLAEDLMVVDSRQLKLALPVEQLLLNIGKALGLTTTVLPPAERLRWPLSETARDGRQGLADARAMVQAYLTAQHEQRPFTTLLLMGGAAARHSLSEQNLAAVESPQVPTDLGHIYFGGPAPGQANPDSQPEPVSVTVLPSLAAMLQKPALKAVTWRAIKHLRVSH